MVCHASVQNSILRAAKNGQQSEQLWAWSELNVLIKGIFRPKIGSIYVLNILCTCPKMCWPFFRLFNFLGKIVISLVPIKMKIAVTMKIYLNRVFFLDNMLTPIQIDIKKRRFQIMQSSQLAVNVTHFDSI